MVAARAAATSTTVQETQASIPTYRLNRTQRKRLAREASQIAQAKAQESAVKSSIQTKSPSGYAKDLNLYRLRGWVGID